MAIRLPHFGSAILFVSLEINVIANSEIWKTDAKQCLLNQVVQDLMIDVVQDQPDLTQCIRKIATAHCCLGKT